MNLINKILNFKVSAGWTPDKKRAYRQVNGLCAFFVAIFSLSTFMGFVVNINILYLQLIATAFYLAGYIFISKHQLKLAKQYIIVIFEIHLFLASFLATNAINLQQFPYFSPSFIGFILFPLLAALFDLSIRFHAMIAFVEIILVNFILSVINPEILLPPQNPSTNLLNLIGSIFTLTTASVLAYLLYNENIIVKNQ